MRLAPHVRHGLQLKYNNQKKSNWFREYTKEHIFLEYWDYISFLSSSTWTSGYSRGGISTNFRFGSPTSFCANNNNGFSRLQLLSVFIPQYCKEIRKDEIILLIMHSAQIGTRLLTTKYCFQSLQVLNDSILSV